MPPRYLPLDEETANDAQNAKCSHEMGRAQSAASVVACCRSRDGRPSGDKFPEFRLFADLKSSLHGWGRILTTCSFHDEVKSTAFSYRAVF
jgi:hypothetical protein